VASTIQPAGTSPTLSNLSLSEPVETVPVTVVVDAAFPAEVTVTACGRNPPVAFTAVDEGTPHADPATSEMSRPTEAGLARCHGLVPPPLPIRRR
jgi:hypothetical protein